jgi:hypothetical protein
MRWARRAPQSVVAAVCALREGIVPPTINYTPDPEIDLHIVGNRPRQCRCPPRHRQRLWLWRAECGGGVRLVRLVLWVIERLDDRRPL